VCQSPTGHMTGLWFLSSRHLRLNTNEWMSLYGFYFVSVGTVGHYILTTVELHLSGLTGTASHPDMQKIRIIGFFLISNFRRVLNAVCFLLGNSTGVSILYADVSEHSVPPSWVGRYEEWLGLRKLGYLYRKTFSTPVILHTHLPMKIQHRVFRNVGLHRLWKWNRQGVPKFRLTPAMKMEQTGCSETSAYTTYEDGTDRVFRHVGLHRLWKWNRKGVPKRRLTPPMKMEQSGCSETSACKILTLGNYPESIQHSDFSLRKCCTGSLQFSCYYLQYVPASKPSYHAWFVWSSRSHNVVYCTWSDNR